MAEREDRLETELRALGATLVVAAPPEDLVEQVLSRVADRPPPARTRSLPRRRTRRRRVVAVVVALVLLVLGLTPPVRAAVAEWLRVGGVVIRTAPATGGPSPTPSPPPANGPSASLAEAQAQVAFPLGVPAELGVPNRVTVSADRRVVGMDWGSGPSRLHLDQFDGQLSWVFVKRARGPFEITTVGDRDGVWFPTAHEVVYVGADGRERREQARIAGPGLVWEREVGGRRVTLRLEGDQPLGRAVAVAESVR